MKIITSIINRIKNKFINLKIGKMILISYFILVVLSIGISTLIYKKINIGIMVEKVEEISYQTNESVSSNIDMVIETVNNSSKTLISNEYIQSTLTSSNYSMDFYNQKVLTKYLSEFINFKPNISSIYIFDNYGNKYYADNESYKIISLDKIKGSEWYEQLIYKKGGYILKLNGGGLFQSNKGNYVSLIRVINNIDTQKPIGYMVINIHESLFSNIFKKVKTNDYENFILLDEYNKKIVTNDPLLDLNTELFNKEIYQNKYDFRIEEIDNRTLMISKLINEDNGWSLININSLEEALNNYQIYKLVTWIIITINGIFIFLGSILISKVITDPIKKLVISMESVKKGEFKPVIIKTGNNEIGEFKNVYNIMIIEIQKLINQIIKEQKINRESELKILQAQIKPHFLYNTFDAISSLSLAGRNEEVYTLIKALGSFYRVSLNNGNYVIFMDEEIETVKSYVTIQKIRYGDMFTVNYNIDSSIARYKIVKLILQPLVENALYHGIKPKGEPGIINITTILEMGIIKLIVEDNGVGMTEEELNRVKNKKSNGIGLSATIERLQIFYGREDVFHIKSKKGIGTKIVITIPEREALYEHK